MEVVSLGLQNVDDCEEFAVVDVIISFSRDEQLQKIGIEV